MPLSTNTARAALAALREEFARRAEHEAAIAAENANKYTRNITKAPAYAERQWTPAVLEQLAQPKEQPMLQGVYRGYSGDKGSAPVYYHGGTYTPGDEVTRPLYMSRNKDLAESYADVKGGSVVKLSPRPKKTANPETLRELASQYVPENEANFYTPASALDAALHGQRPVDRLTYELGRNPNFYDSARGRDVGFYSGLAKGTPEGEALIMLPGTSVPAAPTEELFVTPQQRVADYYAKKRAAQTGEAPHVEMVLIDPNTGRVYGHSTMGTGGQEPMFTNARKISPEAVVERTQLYARGGLAHYKECSCGR